MEIDITNCVLIHAKLFKIDLIVWKLRISLDSIKQESSFKIDLIVWKLNGTINSIKLEAGFKIDLIVWKSSDGWSIVLAILCLK